MAGTFVSPSEILLQAQADSLDRGERLDTLGLSPVNSKAGLDIADSLLSAKVLLTIEGASTLTLTVHDPARCIERSALLDKDGDGRLDSVLVVVDALRFRLASVTRNDDSIDLLFEDEVWALLRAHRGPLSASRGSMTRAEFILKMIREIKTRRIPWYIPEKGKKQPREQPDLPDPAPARGTTGFDKGAKLNVKSWAGSHVLDAEQMRNAATMLGAAEQEDAGEKATLALLEAGIVEAPYFYNNPGGDKTSVGILQLLNIHLGGSTSTHGGRRDVALVSRLFLTKGFAGQGGAIALARAHTDWSAGQVAQAVQGSAFPSRYDQSRAGARTVLDAWNGGGDTSANTHEVLRIKAYAFHRGQPGEPENSAQAAVRLAEEVQWRFYAMGGAVYFETDYYMLTRAADLILEGYGAPGLLDWPTYQWDHRKLAAEVTMKVAANAWGVRAGSIVVLRDMGSPLDGRWIVESFEFDLLDPLVGEVTLTKPTKPKKEPAPEVLTIEEDASGDPVAGSGGAKNAIKWAQSRIGHYAEEFGSNRGAELDALERQFQKSFGTPIGSPWCAEFATTALVMGGVTRDCRTAAVAQINQWAGEGSHGYTRGFRATPQPGDLITFGSDHVGFVEKVNGSTIHTIEGNTGAGKVARVTRLNGSGRIVRPEYPEE